MTCIYNFSLVVIAIHSKKLSDQLLRIFDSSFIGNRKLHILINDFVDVLVRTRQRNAATNRSIGPSFAPVSTPDPTTGVAGSCVVDLFAQPGLTASTLEGVPERMEDLC